MVMQLCYGYFGNGEITHAEFTTAGTPNGRVGPAAIMPIPVSSVTRSQHMGMLSLGSNGSRMKKTPRPTPLGSLGGYAHLARSRAPSGKEIRPSLTRP